MVHSAKLLARLEDGRIALLTGGIPGELVEAELVVQKGVMQGHVSKVLEPSEARLPASLHPGLDYSFMTYEKQLELKRAVVEDALARALKREVFVAAVRPAPEQWHYRNTVQPVVSKMGLGYRKPESHEVVDLDVDPVANEAINRVWQKLPGIPKGVREIVFRANDQAEVLLALIASISAKHYLAFARNLLDDSVKGVSYAEYDSRGRFRHGSESLAGVRIIRQRYGSFELSISPQHFAQPNPAAASVLYQELEQLAPGGKRALDLYAGSGIIAMHLAKKYQEVIALELDRSSVARGEQDAKRLGIDNLSFIRADAKALELPQGLDLITVDPPRAGLNKEVRKLIHQSTAALLIYVSCNVATWVRDVAEFEKLGWQLKQFEPFDFYPQTHHIELLSVLRR